MSLGLACPKCGHEVSSVKDSRPNEIGSEIARRRACCRCGHRWSTIERAIVKARGRPKSASGPIIDFGPQLVALETAASALRDMLALGGLAPLPIEDQPHEDQP